jgi:hypothetical protein
LVQYFKKWGKIEECKIYFENTNKKGNYKGYGFILFTKKETMQIVLDNNEYHTIKGCKFQCKPILLKDELNKVKENKKLESIMNTNENGSMSHHSIDGDDIDSISVEDIAYSVNSMSRHYSHGGGDYYTGNKYPTGYANTAHSNYSGYSGYSGDSYGNYPSGMGQNY